MAKLENTVECVSSLMELMREKGIGKLSYTEESFELTLERETLPPPPAPASFPAFFAPGTASAAPPAAPAQGEPCGKLVRSPIVGTFYGAPSPEKPPFVKAGQKVKKGDVLLIIESMKLMNEIQSEYDGVVAEILVTDGTAVEYDQPLMRIE